MIDLIRREPVRFVAAIQTTLAAAVLFGAPLTEAQLAGIIVAVSAWLAFITREQVAPLSNAPAVVKPKPKPTRPDPSLTERVPKKRQAGHTTLPVLVGAICAVLLLALLNEINL